MVTRRDATSPTTGLDIPAASADSGSMAAATCGSRVNVIWPPFSSLCKGGTKGAVDDAMKLLRSERARAGLVSAGVKENELIDEHRVEMSQGAPVAFPDLTSFLSLFDDGRNAAQCLFEAKIHPV